MLEIGKFQCTIRFLENAQMPEWKGNFIRGVMGKHIVEICCGRKQLVCRGCRQRRNCAYYRLFEADVPPDAKYLTKLEGIPRPIVIKEMGMNKNFYESGESASFGFVLVGNALKVLPAIVGGLQKAGEYGMSIGGGGKFSVEKIVHLDPDGNSTPVFDGGKLRLQFPVWSYEDIVVRSEPRNGEICLNFLTPTQIKAGGVPQTPPEFRSLVSRIGFRLNALANYYSGRLVIPERKIKQILNESEKVRIANSEVEILHEFVRYSYDKVTRHHMFFRGKIWYEGEFSKDAMALLNAGSLLHVGKYAGFGCGEYLIEA